MIKKYLIVLFGLSLPIFAAVPLIPSGILYNPDGIGSGTISQTNIDFIGRTARFQTNWVEVLGATNRVRLEDRIANYYTIEDFGGSTNWTDNTPYVQAAFDTAAKYGMRPVVFGGGTYKFADNTSVRVHTGQIFVGQGGFMTAAVNGFTNNQTVLLKTGTATNALFVPYDPTTNSFGWVTSGFVMQGNGNTKPVISMKRVGGAHIYRNYIDAGSILIDVDGTGGAAYKNLIEFNNISYASGANGQGLVFRGGANQNEIMYNQFSGSATNLVFTDSANANDVAFNQFQGVGGTTPTYTHIYLDGSAQSGLANYFENALTAHHFNTVNGGMGEVMPRYGGGALTNRWVDGPQGKFGTRFELVPVPGDVGYEALMGHLAITNYPTSLSDNYWMTLMPYSRTNLTQLIWNVPTSGTNYMVGYNDSTNMTWRINMNSGSYLANSFGSSIALYDTSLQHKNTGELKVIDATSGALRDLFARNLVATNGMFTNIYSQNIYKPLHPYGASWNGSTNVSTEGDVYQKIELIVAAGSTNTIILVDGTSVTAPNFKSSTTTNSPVIKLAINNSTNVVATLNSFGAPSDVTIASDAIAAPTTILTRLIPESGVSDNLSTIAAPATNGLSMVFLYKRTNEIITIKHAVGNIICANTKDIILGAYEDATIAIGIWDTVLGAWRVSSAQSQLIDITTQGAGVKVIQDATISNTGGMTQRALNAKNLLTLSSSVLGIDAGVNMQINSTNLSGLNLLNSPTVQISQSSATNYQFDVISSGGSLITNTIASDGITLPGTPTNIIKLLPETGTADNLSYIAPPSSGTRNIIIRPVGTNAITLKHGVTNIVCMNQADILLSGSGAVAYLYYDTTITNWVALSDLNTGTGGGGSAPAGTMVNSGASLANAIPEYSDITGTNLIPSKLTITSGTNLLTGTIGVTNRATFNGEVVIPGMPTLTIATDTIDVTGYTKALIETEGGAASDNLSTINGGLAGKLFYFLNTLNSRTVTWKHNTGNMYCAQGADFTTSPGELVVGIYVEGHNKWYVWSTKSAISGTVAIVNGGTGQTSATLGFDALSQSSEVSLASASTVNIGAASSQQILITGTTTITAFDTIAAGTKRWIRFNNTLTLTYNATSLILPNNGVNITTANGDSCTAISLGAGNWKIYNYQKINGQALVDNTGAITGTVVNSGTPLDLAVPTYTGTTGTNIIPSKVTITALTNLNAGNIIATNGVTTGDPASTNFGTFTFAYGVNFTNATTANGITNNINYLFNSNVVFALAPTPVSNGGTDLGTTALQFGNLYLKNGGAINFNNGNYILTHSSGLLTANGAFSIGTGNAFTAGTIELGHATQNTLSASAGDLSIEGNRIFRVGGADVPVADGGTGLSSGTSGGIPYYSSTTSMASSTLLALNNLLIGGGAGAAPASTTTGTGVLTALGNTANAAGGIETVDGTASPTNKTFDTQATGNTLKWIDYDKWVFPQLADEVGAIITTNNAASSLNGHATFSGSAATNANWVVYEWVVPDDIDTAVDLKVARFKFTTAGTSTSSATFNIGMQDIADSADQETISLANFSNWVAMATGTLTSPAAKDGFTISATTLTSWKSNLTAGHTVHIMICRDGANDANNDAMTDKFLVISYGRTQ
jgi:hypothetical protein